MKPYLEDFSEGVFGRDRLDRHWHEMQRLVGVSCPAQDCYVT